MPIKATLQWTEKISPTAIRMRWRSDQAELPFVPGQFYRFRFQDDRGSFQRSYSFAQCDDALAPGDFELLITPVVYGRATELLFGDSAPIEAEIEGPYGRLVLPTSGRKLVLVATSAGLAPYLPMLKALESKSPLPFDSVLLLFGVREPPEFLYRDWIEAFAERNAWFHWQVFYSQTLPLHPGPAEFQGYLHTGLECLDLDPDSDWILLCGNPMMIDTAFESLKHRGFKARRVIREKYLFARQEKQSAASSMSEADRALLLAKMARYGKSESSD